MDVPSQVTSLQAFSNLSKMAWPLAVAYLNVEKPWAD
jgi:hypothetical protein